MLPVTQLGDAAAAESMVQQATRSQRSDQRTNDEIFNRVLSRSREIARLNFVQPADETSGKSRIEEEYRDANDWEEKPKRRRPSSHLLQSPLQPPEMHEELQPMLFDIHLDRVVSLYHETSDSKEVGRWIDRTA